MRPLCFFLIFGIGFLPGIWPAPALGAQERVTPAVPFGGIYAIPEATVRPDPELDYRLVIDVFTGAEEPDSLGGGLYHVSRLLNLFAVAGVPADRVQVVLAIHGAATYGVLTTEAYRERFGVDNPNLPLLRALQQAGVRLTVCGQSLIGRDLAAEAVSPEVEIATSMLTTVAMYQMRGYGVFRF
ncbi:intracellular sulfur oxidation DsrE/DsrF family protein [Neolewinella xylanilytica]|uniref:Intracellular sulfur oxidation DsrE/DsrF family protein n=1 Tax=Neolewinella xylanilytica TaxID=1514080 RepID=A0A2S6I896_9BACT|nr:DsrE family protein [Neolewinella xylanilytica]PPK87715.1 intracellular sulfur oxidation DsrE/DsrF family protein [Neolewinella xylanilytica]